MSEQMTTILKSKLEDIAIYGALDAETRRNALKEELQYYVLNFIYHHPDYHGWIMYGGSALRIIYGLDRMSVDLDFEVSQVVTEKFLKELKKEIEEHFINTYGASTDFMVAKIVNGRGLLLKFYVGEELSFGHASKQVHVKIDLNHFVVSKTVTERWPINHGQLSFVIITYNMSSLMASKLAAIFLRGIRGVGKEVYEEKGRDIYDLLWYMGKKIIPDFDYLIAKKVDVKDPRALFDDLTLQINKVNDKNLKEDLEPLFVNKTFIVNWLQNWRESYLRLLDEYKIRTIKELESIGLHKDSRTDTLSFVYWYTTKDGGSIRIVYNLSEYWIMFGEGDLLNQIDKSLGNKKFEFSGVGWSSWSELPDKVQQYVTLFERKTEKYFKKTNKVMLGDVIITKLIRMTADNLNQKKQIVLNKSALISCELDDLVE